MRLSFANMLPPLLTALTAVLTLARSNPLGSSCPPISGTFRIDLDDVYPESADFSKSVCSVFASSVINNTLVRYNPYDQSTNVISFLNISFNDQYLLCGVDAVSTSGDVYISANARAAFFTGGQNLSGPNALIRYNPRLNQTVWIADVNPVVAKIEKQLSHQIGGFQDQAEDQHGNAYYMSTWGNVIIRVDSVGNPSPFYVPQDNNASLPGFGGILYLEDKLVVSDAITSSFYVFRGSKLSLIKPSGTPADYKQPLNCDSIYAPARYHGQVILCAADQPGGRGVDVYRSEDDWKTAKYLASISNNYQEAPGAVVTATYEATKSIYVVLEYLPGQDGKLPQATSFPMVDVTSRIDAIVDKVS